MHPEKAVPKMLLAPEYWRKMKEEQQALLLRATLLITNNLCKHQDFSYTVVKESRNNYLPEAKIFLNCYRYYF